MIIMIIITRFQSEDSTSNAHAKLATCLYQALATFTTKMSQKHGGSQGMTPWPPKKRFWRGVGSIPRAPSIIMS